MRFHSRMLFFLKRRKRSWFHWHQREIWGMLAYVSLWLCNNLVFYLGKRSSSKRKGQTFYWLLTTLSSADPFAQPFVYSRRTKKKVLLWERKIIARFLLLPLPVSFFSFEENGVRFHTDCPKTIPQTYYFFLFFFLRPALFPFLKIAYQKRGTLFSVPQRRHLEAVAALNLSMALVGVSYMKFPTCCFSDATFGNR